MPMNRIQFQPGLSLAAFLRDYGTEAQCEAAVVAARWPQGVVCDRRRCTRFSPTHSGRRLRQCEHCGHQSSSIVGSVMEHTKLPLTTWFLAMYWVTESKNGASAIALMRYAGVSYPTAWLQRHKLMQVCFDLSTTKKAYPTAAIKKCTLATTSADRKISIGVLSVVKLVRHTIEAFA